VRGAGGRDQWKPSRENAANTSFRSWYCGPGHLFVEGSVLYQSHSLFSIQKHADELVFENMKSSQGRQACLEDAKERMADTWY
jgi:hypothetical protein